MHLAIAHAMTPAQAAAGKVLVRRLQPCGGRGALSGVQTESERRFDAFVAARSPALFRSAYALLGNADDAADALQTALERTWSRWRRIEATGDPAAYVHRVLANASLDVHRRRARRHELLTDRHADTTTVPDRAAAVDDDLLLAQLLATLTPRQRAVVVLRYLGDLTEVATAAALDIPLGTVKSDASRALTQLRTHRPDLLEEHRAH